MRKLAILSIFIFILRGVHAEEGPSPCSALSSPKDVLGCALTNHPDILRAQAEAANLEAFEQLARQRPNPEVDSEFVSPSGEDEPSLSLQASYLHTFELGGKRDRRIDRAKVQRKIALTRLELAKTDVARATVLNLYRLRHLQSELAAVEEGLDTFGKIIRQYRGRRQLSPEQDVSLNVFLLAEGDYALRKSRLLQEQQALKQYFDLATGGDFQAVLNVLPERKTDWPAVAASTSALGGVLRQEAQAAVELSRAELGLARSDAWPDMKLGPLVEAQSGRGQSNQNFGGSLSLALPLYQRNQGARALAQNEMRRAEIHLGQRDRELAAQWRTWREVYQNAVTSLKDIPTIDQMEKKHKNMESLFERGLIQSSLIIEAHRQMADFTESVNDQELRAVEALWSIHALEGRNPQEGL